ncbi:Rhs family protein [Minicystis rosea]|nr:Rhs family protein [Minicystis rosea]
MRSASNGTPALNSNQFSSSSTGSLSNAVNLFRGDVNYQLPIVQLDDSSGTSDLSVQIALFLQSNVWQAVTGWNVDQPTGTLGVGWSLPVEQILLQTEGALSPSAVTYNYQGSGVSSPLIPTEEPWLRASLSATLADSLVPGTVPAALVTAFLAAGLPLSASATLSGNGPWQVQDDVCEHLYVLSLEGDPAALHVLDGGALFQLQSYQFWRIAYYAPFERWEITDDSGNVKVLGGGKSTVSGYSYATSSGNSVIWGVKWGGASGSWTGSSTVTTGQTQYATGWNLSVQIDRWGNRITYAYNSFDRTDGVLGGGSEQLVGTGGLPYTKACYIGTITDPYGRTVSFAYKNKTYTATAQEYVDPHKVLSPASAPGTLPTGIDDPNAYQDRYETQLLDRVTVSAADGTTLYGYAFTYAPPTNVMWQPAGVSLQLSGQATDDTVLRVAVAVSNGSATVEVPVPRGTSAVEALQLLQRACDDSPSLTALATPGSVTDEGSAALQLSARPGAADLTTAMVTFQAASGLTSSTVSVAAGANPTGPLAAAMCKSYLVAITPVNGAGVAQPGYRFDYHWATQGPNLGAIKSIVFPQGGGGRFTYAAEDLHVCRRQQVIAAPHALLGDNAVPYIFYGSDYVVSVWTNSACSMMTLMVHTWVGRWQRWTIDREALYTGDAFDPSTLGFFATQDTFALTLTAGGVPYLYLFNRDPHRQAFWQALDNDGKPYVTYSGVTSVSFAAGARFLVAVTATDGADGTTWDLYRYVHRWQTNGWSGLDAPVITGSTEQLEVLAHDEYYLTMAIDALDSRGTLSVSYLDEHGVFHDPTGTLVYNGFSLNENDGRMVWAGDASIAAFTVATSAGPTASTEGSFTLYIVRWTNAYAFTDTQSDARTVTAAEAGASAWPPLPVLVSNTSVAAGSKVWRFTGAGWTPGIFDTSSLPGGLSWLAYSYGADVGVQAANSSGHPVSSALMAYDPDTGTFSQVAVPANNSVSGQTAGFPHAQSQDFIVANNEVFYRGGQSQDGAIAWGWANAIDVAVGSIPTASDSVTLVDQAPNFLAYTQTVGTAEEATVALLQNGHVVRAETLRGTYNAAELTSPAPGQQPAGPSTITLYADEGSGLFSQAQRYTIHRFAGEDIQGMIRAFPVISMEVFNGYGDEQWTAYAYDTKSASCDSSGEVVKYYRSTTYPGSRDAESARYGRKVSVYLNDLFASGYSMLDGQQLQQISFAGATLFAVPFQPGYGLDPAAAPNQPPVSIADTPALASLAALFANLRTPPLSSQATLQYVLLTVPAATAECAHELLPSQWAEEEVGYRYWVIEDPGTGMSYNLDCSFDPEDPGALKGYVGRVVQSQSSAWALYTARAAGPRSAAVVPLHGAFARNVASTSTTDGVPLVRSLGYVAAGLSAPLSSGIVCEAWSSYGIDGVAVSYAQTTTYGAQIYPALYGANVLSPVAELLTQAQKDGGSRYQISAKASDWKVWPGPDGLSILDLAGTWNYRGDTTQSAVFPFGTTPSTDDWQVDLIVSARDARGNVAETRDAAGAVRSVVRDFANGRYVGQVPLVVTDNASSSGDEAAASGFEQNEDLSAWTFSGGAALDDTIAHTGTQSLHLPAGGSASRAPLTPVGNERVYLVSTWYRIGGSAPATGAGWVVTVSQGDTAVGDPITIPFSGPAGVWGYAQAPIDLAAYHRLAGSEAALSISLSTTMGDAPELWIDDVRFSPRDGSLEMLVHDPATSRPIARLNGTNRVTRITYGSTEQPVCHVGFGDQVRNIDTQWRSLGDDWAGYLAWLGGQTAPLPATPLSHRFDPAAPNASLSVKCQHGGSLVTARDGDAWQKVWKPSDAGAWTLVSGALIHASSTSSDTLSAKGTTIDYAVYVELGDPSAPMKPVTLGTGFQLEVGTAAAVTWNGSQWTLSIGSGAPIESLRPVSGSPSSILLVLTGTREKSGAEGSWLLFFQDGQLLFGQAVTVSGAPALVTGANAVALRNLVLAHGPSLQWQLQDGAGVTRQSHMLSGAGYLVSQVIRDALGKEVVKTKSIPGTFGHGADLPALAYRDALVDTEAFRVSLGGSGEMHGDVNVYYDGSDPAGGRTDDGHYPYSRRRLEDSPLQRTVEVGEAGAAYAIIDPFTSAPSSRNTIQWTYGNNASITLPFPSLPAGQFQVVSRRERTGVVESTVKDNQSQRIGQAVSPAPGSGMSGGPTLGCVLDFDNRGAFTTTYLPNAHQAFADAPAQVVTTQYDPLMRIVQHTSPDAGQTTTLYDAAGNRRFVQDAEGAAKGYFAFFVYDVRGREIAGGIVSGDLDLAQNHLDSPGWPLHGGGDTVFALQTQRFYDGDGHDPNSAGQLVEGVTRTGQSVVSGADAFAAVASRFTWDDHGNLVSSRTVTKWLDGQGLDGDFTMGFSYDNLDQLASITYPTLSGVDFTTVRYLVDGFDKLRAIADDEGRGIAAFRYDAMGQAVSSAEVAKAITGTRSYDSAGTQLGLTDTGNGAVFSSQQTLLDDGTLQTQTDSLTVPAGSSVPAKSTAVTFGYDGINRLTSATPGEDTGPGQGFSYTDERGIVDLNGNVRAVTGANAGRFAVDRNRVVGAVWGDGSTTTRYTYLANGVLAGRVSSPAPPAHLPDWQCAVVEGGILPATITVGSTTLELAYDIRGHRVGKRSIEKGVHARTTLSVPGKHRPFAQVSSDGTAVAFVYGAHEIVAMSQGGARYAVATDQLGSVRAVFDTSGAVVASYDYLAYGAPASPPSEPSSNWLPLRFTGAELDVETGLYNFNARLYDPALGRFSAPDPQQEYASPYVYVGGLPNRLVDPTGELTQGEALLIDVGLAVIGIGLAVGLPEDIPFLSWAVAGMFTGAASSGALNVLTLPKNWSSTSFWASLAFGGFMGIISGGFIGGWVGKEAPITDDALRAAGFDKETGVFAAGGEQAESTWGKTKAVGKDIYTERLKKRRPAYAWGYAIQGLAVVTNFVGAKNQTVAGVKSIGEFFLYPAYGFVMAHPLTFMSSMGAAAKPIYMGKTKKWWREGSGETSPLLETGMAADFFVAL